MTSPLKDKHIVVTRADHQADEFVRLLQTQGAIAIRYPCIAIIAPRDTHHLDQQLSNLADYHWLLLTSPNAVHIVHQRLVELDYRVDWSTVRIGVVGTKTAHTAESLLGQPVDFIPDIFTGEQLGKTLPDVKGKRIFLPQSALADETLVDILRQRGASVDATIAYQNVVGTGGDDVPARLQAKQIDLLTFTSSSTVENFLQRIHPLSVPDVPALCIGPSTAKTARDLGFSQVYIPDETSLQGMVTKAIDILKSNMTA